MALEKLRNAVSAQAVTQDGTANGQISVADTSLFSAGQIVIVAANTMPNVALQVKRIYSPTLMSLGLEDKRDLADLTGYSVANSATISANEQPKSDIDFTRAIRGVYEEEPIVANRVLLVDKNGQRHDDSNPISADIASLSAASTAQYTVGTSAVQVDPDAPEGRRSISVRFKATTSGALAYLGFSSGVSSSTGYLLTDGDSMTLDVGTTVEVWVVASHVAQKIFVCQVA